MVRKNSQIEQALDMLKMETASELGVQTGPDQTSRNNGSVGGQMVRKLVQQAESILAGQTNQR